jgi:maleate isomerase
VRKRLLQRGGFEVRRMTGFCCRSPMLIAQLQESELRRAITGLDGNDEGAILRCGTKLACARLAAEPEAGLQKAVIAVNTAIYWQALRTAGIEDRIEGSGSLLESH